MAVPDFQTLMRPLLAALVDGQERRIADVREQLTRELRLSAEDLQEELPSGADKVFRNRVGWATTYLFRTGLIERPGRGVYRISDRGRRVLREHPERVDLRVLGQFPELAEFRGGRDRTTDDGSVSISDSGETPEERMDAASRELRSALAVDLAEAIEAESPQFFERLVIDLLTKMGYGGRREDAARHLGRSGDEGIDGVIQEDRLGLDRIYVQAKRWTGNAVGRPEIQKFVGALQGQGASKGVFLTTSTFSVDARDYASRVSPRVVLIDGRQLAGLMIDYGVGVAVEREYLIKRLDRDYFSSEDDAGL